jgi:hypothetical protein
LIAAILFAVFLPCAAQPYSVLAHEAVVDALWNPNIKNVLLAHYPGATPDQLRIARAYAYGGAIVQDMGYYPFGNKFFSDLTHYVRSGDFVVNLLAEARDVNECAFALGALSHYVADDNGHRIATNRVVPMLYPRLSKKFGKVVTYEDDPVAHVKTEFGFDVLEVAKGRFAPAAYHDFIGFEVAKPLLERAFRDTYSLDLNDVFNDLDLSLGSFRRSVSKTIPLATQIAWVQRHDEIQHSEPGITRKRYLYYLSRARYEKEWGKYYSKPGLGARFLAFLLKLIPKIGPLRALAFHMPTPAAEQLFMQSFDVSATRFSESIKLAGRNELKLADTNFDTGQPVMPGTYLLADETYAMLVAALAGKKFSGLDQTTKSQVLSYYQNLAVPFATKKNEKAWRRLVADLDQLRNAPAISAR